MTVDVDDLASEISAGIYGDDRMSVATLNAAVAALSALVAEVERLRAESATFRRLLAEVVQTSADLCPACGWRFLVPGDGCQKCELDKAREERDEMRRWAEEAAHAENLNALDARRERERAVAFLREGDTVCMECGDRAVLDLAYRIECGEHMKDEP